ncbi:MAG TPA: manganese efflux pump [Kofleriaceae bacterium]|nr:manganese efflux pump [Kofleriaceae bacterium]
MLIGIVTGSDNLHFGAAWGLLPMSARRRLAFAIGFAIAELGMTLVGFALGARWGSDLPATLAFAIAGALVVIGVVRRADLARLAGHPAALVAVPLALSFDNLASGAGLGAHDAGALPAAVLAGGVSALLAAVGLFAAGAVARRLPRIAAPLAGALLLALAAQRVVEAL